MTSYRTAASGIPPSVDWNGQELNLWTFGQLDAMSKLNLKQRALNLRDLIGADQLPPLSTTGQREATVRHTGQARMRGA